MAIQGGREITSAQQISDAIITNDKLVTPGQILQVLSTTKTDTFSTGTTGSWVDITGMSVSITPSSTSSKILVIFNGNASGTSATSGFYIQLLRGSTPICVGDTVAGKVDSSTGGGTPDANWSMPCGVNYLDSPSTTSAVTYKIQGRVVAGTFYFNRSQNDGTDALRAASTITVTEIAG